MLRSGTRILSLAFFAFSSTSVFAQYGFTSAMTPPEIFCWTESGSVACFEISKPGRQVPPPAPGQGGFRSGNSIELGPVHGSCDDLSICEELADQCAEEAKIGSDGNSSPSTIADELLAEARKVVRAGGGNPNTQIDFTFTWEFHCSSFQIPPLEPPACEYNGACNIKVNIKY